jgi:hypothetical protein
LATVTICVFGTNLVQIQRVLFTYRVERIEVLVTHNQIDVSTFIVVKLVIYGIGFTILSLHITLKAKHFFHVFRAKFEQIAQKEAIKTSKNVHCVVEHKRRVCITWKHAQARVQFLACEPFVVECVVDAQIV